MLGSEAEDLYVYIYALAPSLPSFLPSFLVSFRRYKEVVHKASRSIAVAAGGGGGGRSRAMDGGDTAAQVGKTRRFRRVCVFCGSSPGKKAAYQVAAIQLGHHLVERGIDLVYGGGSVGLMGLVSRAVHNAGGHVVGVVPKSLLPRELIGETLGEVKAVSGMHQRKAEMARQSDAFIALPGGYGTLEELLEVITWAQLGIHSKPVGLLNVDGYYDSLLSFIDKAVDEGFIAPAARHIIVSAHTPGDLLAALEEYAPAHDASAIKLTWESMEQIGTIYSPKPDISR